MDEINPQQYGSGTDPTDASMRSCPRLESETLAEMPAEQSTTAPKPATGRTITLVDRECTIDSVRIRLTGREAEILKMLLAQRGRVVTKQQLFDRIYYERKEPEFKILDVFVCKMRKKFRNAVGDDIIESSWGRGFMIDTQ